jgi:hypothetical protein
MLYHFYLRFSAVCVILVARAVPMRVCLAWGLACLITAAHMLARGASALRNARVPIRMRLAWGLTYLVTAVRMRARGV